MTYFQPTATSVHMGSVSVPVRRTHLPPGSPHTRLTRMTSVNIARLLAGSLSFFPLFFLF